MRITSAKSLTIIKMKVDVSNQLVENAYVELLGELSFEYPLEARQGDVVTPGSCVTVTENKKHIIAFLLQHMIGICPMQQI